MVCRFSLDRPVSVCYLVCTLSNRPKYGLYKKALSAIHREFHDFDYLDKLSVEEKEFLSRYVEETLQAHFVKDGEDFYDGDERRQLYREANARRRCLHGVAKITGKLLSLDAITYVGQEAALSRHELIGSSRHDLQEDAIIAELDRRLHGDETDEEDS